MKINKNNSFFLQEIISESVLVVIEMIFLDIVVNLASKVKGTKERNVKTKIIENSGEMDTLNKIVATNFSQSKLKLLAHQKDLEKQKREMFFEIRFILFQSFLKE